MKKNTLFLFQCLILFTICLHGHANSDSNRKLHIVYMGALSERQISPLSQHVTMLQQVVGSSSLEDILVRSYGRSFNGFAAMISEGEKEQLSSMEGVVSVFPSRTLYPQTTRSWNFVGLNESSRREKTVESNIIIGVIDGGIWPESKSFNDKGFGTPPKKWKGVCKGGQNFTCNNKIIGARYYVLDSVRDSDGHGSHTASTAAGNYVKDVSVKGLGNGTAKGGVPSARIAAYRVCHEIGCDGAAVLAAFDDAIADGVDIITISLGGYSAEKFEVDTIAIGSFHAMEKGILVTHSAGNNGPDSSTVISVAPWLFTVAASTTDRVYMDKIILANGKTVKGFAINPTAVSKRSLVYDEDIEDDLLFRKPCTLVCNGKCILDSKVEGKILLCRTPNHYSKSSSGPAGIISNIDPEKNISFYDTFPLITVEEQVFKDIRSYIKSTKNPEAEILKSEFEVDSTAPVVAVFSSRGPNQIVPQILKPDISAPGVNILAAYSPIDGHHHGFDYFILSGTSMSCPHVAGVAAYVKSFHPDWSPSAIKSAIMTTAWRMDPNRNKDAEFAYGSGHIDPVKAIDPGLVYETQKSDYITMLCSNGFSDEILRKISGDNSSCPKDSHKLSWKDLNYPTMAANLTLKKPFEVKFNRTVTNVGRANSVYKATVSGAGNVRVKVEPNVLSFNALNVKKSFMVTVSGLFDSSFLSLSLVWSDGKHSVRSPIVLFSDNDGH